MEKFIKFGLVGVLNTGITIFSYAILVYVFKMYFILANIIAYFLGMINSYIWNKNWVFKVKESHFLIYIKFVVVNIFVLGLNTLGLFILVDIYEINKMISQILVVGISTIINFLLTKLWTFSQGGDTLGKGELRNE